MADIHPENAFAMYALDFLWKMIMVRFEYYIEDEEERIKKLQNMYEKRYEKDNLVEVT